jgi:phosphatidate cytidylyltransferase
VSNLAQRVLTALIAIPVAIGIIYLGGALFALMVLLLAAGAQIELYRMAERAGASPLIPLGLAVGAVAALRAMVPYALALIVAGLLLMLLAELFRRRPAPLLNVAAGVFGVFYPAALLGFLLDLRLAESPFFEELSAFYLTMALFLVIWATDTMAYFTGRAFGRHALFPRVSPKKTWEGAIGGLAGGLITIVVLKLTLLPFLTWTDAIVVGLICGGLSQLGDLVESLFKRSVDLKDSATFIPGHGGILDRFDAMLIAAPLVYLYLDTFTHLW